jgi:hypothetical protein
MRLQVLTSGQQHNEMHVLVLDYDALYLQMLLCLLSLNGTLSIVVGCKAMQWYPLEKAR